MSAGNFSNSGRHTFDPAKQYIGIRLQQGVPLLDRDWNELEDIRRYFERSLRRHHIGDGVPDIAGFEIHAADFRAPNDFMIGGGLCLVNGYEVHNPKAVLYSEQSGVDPLPTPDGNERLTVFLQTSVVQVDSSVDPDLLNRQDINLETCVRDKLNWEVRVARHPEQPPADAYALATIERSAGQVAITNDMITDLRRTNLNLAHVVDLSGDLKDRVESIEERVDELQLEIEDIKEQLSRLFWDVNIESSLSLALFGANVRITVSVTDGLGRAVHGARLSFSTDWGSLDPATAVTGANGRASIDLIGVRSETPPLRADVGLLQGVVAKMNLATLSNPGAIQYSQVKFAPQELSLISKYSPASFFHDLAVNLPTGPIVAIPAGRTATVTVHAKEGEGAIVRGVGSIQVRFGLWVRDWARDRIVDVISRVDVGARIGDIMRQGVETEAFNYGTVVGLLPTTMQDISDDTQSKFKVSILDDPSIDDTELSQTGFLGQIIAQEATAAVGQKTNLAVANQIKQFTEDESIPLDTAGAKIAQTAIVQTSSQIAAGFAQNQKQTFSSSRFTG